jgi:glucose-6-phosphate isomerase
LYRRSNDKAQQIRSQFDAFVVLGIGGSALGPIAVQQALNDLHYNELPASSAGGRSCMWKTTWIRSGWLRCSM